MGGALNGHLLVSPALFVTATVTWSGPVASQGIFPPGYDVPLSAPYGDVTIGRPRGPASRPVVIYFPDAAWPNDAICYDQGIFAALDAAGIAVAQLWLGGDTLGRDIRSVERGLRTIRQRADSYRLDLTRVALLGCGAGAHFAALAATNPELMAGAGLNLSSIAGVAIVDGVGFDLRAVAATPANDAEARRGRRGYFSGSMADLDVYSPQSHLAAPNAPSLLVRGRAETEGSPTALMTFARNMQAAGAELVVERLPEKAGEAGSASAGQSPEADGGSIANYLISRLNLVTRRQ